MAKKIKVRKEEAPEEAVKAEEEKKLAEQGIQDEFQAKGFELVEWVQDNRGTVVGILAAVLVLGFAFAAYNLFDTSRDREASAAYAAALKSYDAPITDTSTEEKADGPRFANAADRARAARDLFQKVVDEHGGTGAATLALLYVGDTSMQLDDFDRAVAAYQKFLDESAAKDPLRFAGFAGLAAAKEAKGDVDGAIQALQAQVDLPGKVDEDAALLALGRLYKQKGDAAKARAALERIGKDFPESTLKPRADELLLSLGGEAAPAPAPAPGSAPPAP